MHQLLLFNLKHIVCVYLILKTVVSKVPFVEKSAKPLINKKSKSCKHLGNFLLCDSRQEFVKNTSILVLSTFYLHLLNLGFRASVKLTNGFGL